MAERSGTGIAHSEVAGPADGLPPPHVPITDDHGVTIWRPVLTTLSVHGVPSDHKARHLVIREDGVERFRFKLSGEDAQHIASRLVDGAASDEAEGRPA